jgi:hypothetical protein
MTSIPTDDLLAQFLSQYTPQVRDLAMRARALVLEALPGALELVDAPSKIVAYGYGSKYADLVCAIQPHAAHVNLIFSKGAALADPDGLLAGTGKRARHVRFEKVEDIERPGVRALIERARG